MPGVVGVGLGVCGALLVLKGVAARRSGGDVHWMRAAAWTRSPRHVLAFVVALGVNAFYILAVNVLGFVVTGTVYLAALFCVFGVKPARAVPIALVVTVAI